MIWKIRKKLLMVFGIVVTTPILQKTTVVLVALMVGMIVLRGIDVNSQNGEMIRLHATPPTEEMESPASTQEDEPPVQEWEPTKRDIEDSDEYDERMDFREIGRKAGDFLNQSRESAVELWLGFDESTGFAQWLNDWISGQNE